MRSTFAIAVVVAASVPCAAVAEQPNWDESAERLLVIRQHDIGSWRDGLGLWSFDADSGPWSRLRYFTFTSHSYQPDAPGGGVGGSLAAADVLVYVQAWPMTLELEAGSYRLIRRTSALADPAARGWAVQGPMVSASDALALGLSEGTYGFARCLLADLDPYGYAGGCPPYWVSDTQVRCRYDAPWPLLHREPDGNLHVAALLPPLDWPQRWSEEALPTLLSLDPERHAFWRGAPHGVELIPFDGDTYGPVEEHTFTFPPFDDPEVILWGAYYHPRRHQLFVSAYGSVFALDESLAPVATFADNPVGAMTSLGDPPASLEQILPIVAHTAGSSGTFWTSDLWLFNPAAEATTAHLRRVAAPLAERTVNLAPHGSLRLPDVLAELGGGPAGDLTRHDALVVTAPYRWGEQLVAASRTWTPAPGGGSFGHAVTAAPGRAGYSNHLPFPGEPEPDWILWAMGGVPYANPSLLHLDRSRPGQYRHNLGVANDFDEPVTLTLLWGYFIGEGSDWFAGVTAERPAAALQTVEVAPHSVRVVSLENLFPAEVKERWPPRVAVWGSRPVALWLSMVDNLTGDATFVPYSDLGWAEDLIAGDLDDVRATVPVVASSVGAASSWQTDLYGSDWYAGWYWARAWLHPRNPATDCGGAALSGEVKEDLPGVVAMPGEEWPEEWYGWATMVPDVAHAFSECQWTDNLQGGLELNAGTWLVGWTRTYTTRPDGGTFGDMLPLYPLGGWPVQHFAGVELGPQYRVNVGLFNGDGEHSITHRITLYAANGSQAAERVVTLAPYASLVRRLEHLFRLEVGTLPAGTYGLTVLPLDDPEQGVKGRSWAWVSLVDQVTGDPTNWW